MTDETKLDNSYTMQLPARMAFGNLIVPVKVGKRGQGKGEPKFSATILLKPDSADLMGMKAVAARVAKAEFPGRSLKELKFPFEAGETRAAKAAAEGKDGSFFLGHVVFDARSGDKYAPELVVPIGGKLTQLKDAEIAAIGKQKFFNGCWIAAGVTFHAYRKGSEGGIGEFSGVNARLKRVVWLPTPKGEDGKRIGGSDPVETFRHFAGLVSSENPMGAEDLENEIPF